MFGVGYWVSKRARLHPGRAALVGPDRRWTYRELDERVNRLAHGLANRMGVGRGDRLAILSLNCPEYVEVLLATARLGAVLVPLNFRLTIPELSYQLDDSGARWLVVGPEQQALAGELRGSLAACIDLAGEGEGLPASEGFIPYRELLAGEPGVEENPEGPVDQGPVGFNTPFIICYTSGTTGKPKGAVLTHGNLFWNALNDIMAIDLTSRDVTLTLLPLFHVGGIGLFTLPTLLAGGTVVLPRRFDPREALELIARERVTVVFGVPTIHQRFLEAPGWAQADLSSVRMFYSGGAPCPVEVIEAFHRRGVPFGQGYGLTETSPTVYMLDRDDFQRKAGSVGKPALFCEARVVDENGAEVPPGQVGEIVVRGPNVFREYWNLPDATAQSIKDGWFHTGDLGRQDEEGYVYIVGRIKDMIISGGENIYPLEVEQVLQSHPAVAEVAVFGVPDPRWGEVPRAAVVLRPGQKVSMEELLAYCEGKLARYKIPKEVVFLTELPRSASGKVLKHELARHFS